MMTEELQWDIVGKDILRREDEWFLRGAGRFLDDLPEPRDLIHLGFVGSVHAHARILSIDTRAAQALPGVIDVLTGADFTDLIGPVRPDIDIAGYKDAPRRVVAVDKVRFVGESVAVILAETPYIAQDAIELVEVEYDPLPPVPDPDAGVAADAALIHEGLEDNLLFQSQFKTDGFDAIFDAADLVLSEEFRTGRVAGVPIEPRGCMAILDHVADSVTLWTTTQIPHLARTIIANALDMPESKLRVVLPSVGGGFGTKAQIYPDEFIAVALARKLGRAVKWVQDRREELLTNIHSRHHIYRIDVAVNSDAVIQAVRVDFTTDSGAYSSCPYGCTLETTGGARMLPGPYRIRNYAYHIRSVATTTAPVGVYRGVAQPSCFFTIEGMMDRIGRKLGVDPAEVRRRNIIRPEELPYVNVVGVRYDTGSYLPSLERALEIIGYEDFRKRQPVERLVDGKYRGIGICNFTEVSGTGAPGWRARGLAKVPGFDSALVKVEPDGKVTVFISHADAGQGHYTTFAQIAADRLGARWEDVTIVEGDTAMTPYGTGTFASRSAVTGGGAVIRACAKVAGKMRRIAGEMLEADARDIRLNAGRAEVEGVPDLSLSFAEVAETAYSMNNLVLPEGEDYGLEASDFYDPPLVTMANAVHVVQVAVDAEDGRIEIERYVIVHDCGRIINPTIVNGQIHGGTAQGIGEALMEELVYDTEGQLLNANLLDYLLPTCLDMPELEIDHIESPTIDTEGGFKGVGEGGVIGAVPSIANAVADALAGLGANINRVPLRPSYILEQIQGNTPKSIPISVRSNG